MTDAIAHPTANEPQAPDPASAQEQAKIASRSTTPQAVAANTDATKITAGTMEELKDKAPEVHKAMMEGLAGSMINRMRRQNERLKQLIKEAERND